VFSLSTLICSVLIFNVKNNIDETSIQTLGFIARLTEHIKIKSNAAAAAAGAGAGTGGGALAAPTTESMDELNRYFPNFVWVVRDFTLQLHDEVCVSGRPSPSCGSSGACLCAGVWP
jgi:hypothetical protein